LATLPPGTQPSVERERALIDAASLGAEPEGRHNRAHGIEAQAILLRGNDWMAGRNETICQV